MFAQGDDDGEAALAPEEEEEAEAAEALDEVPMPPRKRARGQARPRAVVRTMALLTTTPLYEPPC